MTEPTVKMPAEIPVSERIASLEKRLKARRGKPGMEVNVKAIEQELDRLRAVQADAEE